MVNHPLFALTVLRLVAFSLRGECLAVLVSVLTLSKQRFNQSNPLHKEAMDGDCLFSPLL